MGIDNGHAIRGSDDRIGAFQQNDATEIRRCAAGALALRFDSRHRLFSTEKTLKFPFMRRDDNAPLSSFFSDQPLEGRCIPSKARQSIGIEHHGPLRTESEPDGSTHRSTDAPARSQQHRILARIFQERCPVIGPPHHDRIKRGRMSEERLLRRSNRHEPGPNTQSRPCTEPCCPSPFDATREDQRMAARIFVPCRLVSFFS